MPVLLVAEHLPVHFCASCACLRLSKQLCRRWKFGSFIRECFRHLYTYLEIISARLRLKLRELPVKYQGFSTGAGSGIRVGPGISLGYEFHMVEM